MQTMERIYETMRQTMEELSGMLPEEGGDLALRLRAVAAELYSLWQQADFVLRQCFPQTAEGEYLDSHGQIRGITRQGGAHAVGNLKFSVSTAAERVLTIPVGTVCTDAAGNRFETTAAGSIAVGQTSCTVAARAVESGRNGNAGEETVTYMVSAPVGVEFCTNPEAFQDGTAGEEDESLRRRILSSYQKLPNGANVAYYETQAMDVDGVAAVQVLPRNRGVGTVDVVIASAGGMPAHTLLNAVQTKLNRLREICVDLKVLSPTAKSVNVTAAVTVNPNYDEAAVLQAVKDTISQWFNGRLLGQAVYRAKLGSLIYSVEGVENYTLSQPAADLAANRSVLPVLGALVIEKAGA